jgi:hypothetical protein
MPSVARSSMGVCTLIVLSSWLTACNRLTSSTAADHDQQARLDRLERRVGERRELQAAPGGGELGAGPTLAKTSDVGTLPLDSATAQPGGEAGDDHQILYCPSVANAPLRDIWFTFSDRDIVGGASCWTGSSSSYLWTVLDRPPSADCAVGWTGVVTGDLDQPFAGVGAELDEPDLGDFRAVALRVRGDGATVRFEAAFRPQTDLIDRNDCEDGNLDFHGISFACGDGTDSWEELTLSFSDFRQQGWGERFTPTWSAVEKVQLRVLDLPLLPDVSTPPLHPERTIRGKRTDGFECDFEVVGFIPR